MEGAIGKGIRYERTLLVMWYDIQGYRRFQLQLRRRSSHARGCIYTPFPILLTCEAVYSYNLRKWQALHEHRVYSAPAIVPRVELPNTVHAVSNVDHLRHDFQPQVLDSPPVCLVAK